MRTSAYTNFGIDELFFKVGESFLNQENFYSPIKLDKTISLIQNESSDKISINDDKTNIKKNNVVNILFLFKFNFCDVFIYKKIFFLKKKIYHKNILF